MEKPLPDRIRPLEGVGFYNLMDDAGYERRREWRWAAPVTALLIAAFLAWLVLAW